MTHREEIANLVLELEEVYSNRKPLTSGALSAYVDDLEPYTLEQITFAIKQHRQMSKWFPSIAELLELAPRHVYSDDTKDRSDGWGALTTERHMAMESYYAGQHIDLEALARKFDRADRPDGAAAIRRYVNA